LFCYRIYSFWWNKDFQNSGSLTAGMADRDVAKGNINSTEKLTWIIPKAKKINHRSALRRWIEVDWKIIKVNTVRTSFTNEPATTAAHRTHLTPFREVSAAFCFVSAWIWIECAASKYITETASMWKNRLFENQVESSWVLIKLTWFVTFWQRLKNYRDEALLLARAASKSTAGSAWQLNTTYRVIILLTYTLTVRSARLWGIVRLLNSEASAVNIPWHFDSELILGLTYWTTFLPKIWAICSSGGFREAQF